MTQFEQVQQQVKDGTLRTPSVSTANGNIDYFGYPLAVHKYNLSLMAKGIMSRGVKLKDLKAYYGLKGRTAADCLPQFLRIFDEYKGTLVMN
jgi:hypothetical protein